MPHRHSDQKDPADSQASTKLEDAEVKEDAREHKYKWPIHHAPLKLDWIEATSIASTGSGKFDMVLLLPPPPKDCAARYLSNAVRPALEYPSYHAIEGILEKCAHVIDVRVVGDVIDEVVRTTLLSWAISALDDLRLIRFLDIALERDFDVNTRCKSGEPLYCHDKVMERPKLFRWFLQHGVHVNECTTSPPEASQTSITEPTVGLPLHKAISSSNKFPEQIIEELLRHKACPLKSNALHAAIRSQRAITMVKLLADYGYDWDPYEWQGNEQFDRYWKQKGQARRSACSLAYSLGKWNLLAELEKMGFDTSLGLLDPVTDRCIKQPEVKKWETLFNKPDKKPSRTVAKSGRKASAPSKGVDRSHAPSDVVAVQSQALPVDTRVQSADAQVSVNWAPSNAPAPARRAPALPGNVSASKHVKQPKIDASKHISQGTGLASKPQSASNDTSTGASGPDNPRRSKRISFANELASRVETQLADTPQPTTQAQETQATVEQPVASQSGTKTRKRKSSAIDVSADSKRRQTRARVTEVRA